MMCVNVNALPEECLLLVFDRIPLIELLLLDRVCYLWAFLLKSATARRRTLVLNVGGYKMDEFNFVILFNDHMTIPTDGGRPYYDLPVAERVAVCTLPNMLPHRPNNSFDQFLEDGYDKSEGFFDVLYRPDGPKYTEMARFRDAHLNGQLGTYLAILLPNVVTLVVIHPDCFEDDLHSIVDLLGLWSLVTLKLWLRTRDIDQRYVHHRDQHPVGTLLSSINNLRPSLRQLTLDIYGKFKGDFNNNDDIELHEYTFPMESFAFISQLKVVKLYLQMYDSHNSIWNTVHRYNSAKLNQIALGTSYTIEAALNPQFVFATKVRQLTCLFQFESVEQLGQVCLRFTCLTVLGLYWTANITFTELVANLSSLRQLTHLRMFIVFEQHPVNAFALVDGDKEPRRISLEQVKILEFKIKKHTHQDFESLSPTVFPSVEMVILRDNQLEPNLETECIICRPNGGPSNIKLANRCHQLLLRSLRKRVTTNSSVRLYPAPDPVSNTERFLDALEHFIVFVVVMAILIGILAY